MERTKQNWMRDRLGWLGLAVVSAAALVPITVTAAAGRLSWGDAAVRDLVLAYRLPALEWTMLVMSWLSSEYVTPLVLAAVVAVGWRRARRRVLVAAAVVATSTLWQIALKAVVGRPRPEPLLYPLWHGAGFPSGHALTALVLAYVVWRLAPALGFSRRAQTPLGWAVVLYPLLVGVSRIYLNSHYLSDVTGGVLLGLGHLGLAFGLFGADWLDREGIRS